MSPSAPYSLETGLVAVTLSTVVRLQQAFLGAAHEQRRDFLLAAADMMDRTIPSRGLAPALRAASHDPVPVLVANRDQIAAVPPGLWRSARREPKHLGHPHEAGLTAVDKVLRREPVEDESLHNALVEWLAPAWLAYPQLRAEAVVLLKPAAATSGSAVSAQVLAGALL